MVFVSGTGAANDTATGAVRERSAFEETRGALENVAAILRAADSAPEHIAVVTMLLTDKDDYAEAGVGSKGRDWSNVVTSPTPQPHRIASPAAVPLAQAGRATPPRRTTHSATHK